VTQLSGHGRQDLKSVLMPKPSLHRRQVQVGW